MKKEMREKSHSGDTSPAKTFFLSLDVGVESNRDAAHVLPLLQRPQSEAMGVSYGTCP